MNNSEFVSVALKLLDNEIEKISYLTDQLDKSPDEKKKNIAVYKCAKYRYASLINVRSSLWHNYRCGKISDPGYSHHLLLPFDEILKKHKNLVEICKSAPVERQQDYSLYYSIIAFSSEMISELKTKLKSSDDWEATELKERIKGFETAVSCLDKARKDGEEVVQ